MLQNNDFLLWLEILPDPLILPAIEEYGQMTGEDLSGFSRHEQIQRIAGDWLDEYTEEMEDHDIVYEGRMVSENEFFESVNNESGAGIGAGFASIEEFMAELREAYCTDTFAYCMIYADGYQEEMPVALGYYEDIGKWIPMIPEW